MVGESTVVFTKRVLGEKHISSIMRENPGGATPSSPPASLQTKICYKSLIFVYRKSIWITGKPKKLAF